MFRKRIIFSASIALALFSILYSPFSLREAHASMKLTSGSETGLVGWWKFDEGSGTLAADASGNHNTGTLAGTTKPVWVAGKHGKALSFDGITSVAYATDTSSLRLTSSGTVSVWINPKAYPANGAWSTVFAKGNWAGGLNDYTIFFNGTNGNLYFEVSGSGETDITVPSSSVPLNKWTHLMITWSGGNYSSYVNGVFKGSHGITGTPDTSTYKFVIGAPLVGGANEFAGSIDDVRVYSRALSAAEIYKLYKSGSEVVDKIQPVRLNSGLVGYWSFDGGTIQNGHIADLSGNGNTGYPTNIATSTFYTSGKIGQRVNFNGVNNYVKAFITTPTVVTVSAWVYPNNLGTEQHFAEIAPLQFYTTGTNLNCYASGSVGVKGGLVNRKWNFITVYNDNAGNCTVYLNGVKGTTGTGGSNLSGSTVFIGRWYSTNSLNFNGLIDDVRIYNRALSPAEIKALYQMGQETADKSPVNRINSGLVGYWTFDGSTIKNGHINDVSGNNNTAYPISIATSTFYTSGKIGQGAGFKGANQYVISGTLGDAALTENGPMTISAWIKPAKIGGAILARDGGAAGPVFNFGSSQRLEFYVLGNTQINRLSTTNVITTNSWQHVVVTWDGSLNSSNIHLYVNGVNVDSSTKQDGVSLTDNSTKVLYIGDTSNLGVNSFNGLEDDVRIYNRALSPGEVKQLYNMGR